MNKVNVMWSRVEQPKKQQQQENDKYERYTINDRKRNTLLNPALTKTENHLRLSRRHHWQWCTVRKLWHE